MNKPGLGGGMKRGSGRGRRLDFLPSSSFSPSVPPFCAAKIILIDEFNHKKSLCALSSIIIFNLT